MKLAKTILIWFFILLVVIGCVTAITLGVDHFASHIAKASFDETNIIQMTNNGYIDLYVDMDTSVVYVRAVNGTLTPMINADGTPKLWKAAK